jgi:RimJ/RimL family protein N-acetyltransferase
MTLSPSPALSVSSTAPDIVIAVPGESDVPALVALINALAAEHSQLFIQPVDPQSGIGLVRDHLAAIARSGTEAVLVARAGDALLGLVTGTRGSHPARNGVVEIGIGVRAGHRGKGIGTALLAAIEQWARTSGCHRLSLHVVTTNTPAIALYRKVGFTSEGLLKATAIMDGHPVDELQMGKLLAPTR